MEGPEIEVIMITVEDDDIQEGGDKALLMLNIPDNGEKVSVIFTADSALSLADTVIEAAHNTKLVNKVYNSNTQFGKVRLEELMSWLGAQN